MRLKDAERLVQEMEKEGYDVLLYPQYSGRGMYGSTTAGIVADQHVVMHLGWYASYLGIPVEELPMRVDNMGNQMIYY